MYENIKKSDSVIYQEMGRKFTSIRQVSFKYEISGWKDN